MQAIFLLPQQTKEARNIGQSGIQRTQSEQKRGRTLSPATKAKISEALKGKPRQPFTPKHRARIGKAKKGKPRSPEMRAKIAATNKQLIASFENRSNLMTYEEKTSEQTTRAHPKQTGKKVGDHAHFRSTSVRGCHAFF